MEQVMDRKWNRTELITVVDWLEARHAFLHSEELFITAGDDFAHSNGRWPQVQNLRREASAIHTSLQTAREQLGESDAAT
jgi:hypothetical protein